MSCAASAESTGHRDVGWRGATGHALVWQVLHVVGRQVVMLFRHVRREEPLLLFGQRLEISPVVVGENPRVKRRGR